MIRVGITLDRTPPIASHTASAAIHMAVVCVCVCVSSLLPLGYSVHKELGRLPFLVVYLGGYVGVAADPIRWRKII
jgi:hypothetical protein